MERQPKTRISPKFRGRMHPVPPSALFFHIFSRAREKIGPPEARQKRPRRNESLQARLLILCARFFLSKPQTEFAVWVLWQICSNLSGASRQHPYPFCPFGTFPPDRGNRPLEGEPRSAHRQKCSGSGRRPLSQLRCQLPWEGSRGGCKNPPLRSSGGGGVTVRRWPSRIRRIAGADGPGGF